MLRAEDESSSSDCCCPSIDRRVGVFRIAMGLGVRACVVDTDVDAGSRFGGLTSLESGIDGPDFSWSPFCDVDACAPVVGVWREENVRRGLNSHDVVNFDPIVFDGSEDLSLT